MFSRSKDKDSERPVAQAAVPAPTAPVKRTGVRTAPSIISNDLVVHGNLVATGDIQVDGTVEGDIRSQSLTIGEKASIHGELVAEDIVIRGRVIGTIRGRRVQLASTCHVEGDILHEALAVETGAFFEGNCRHSDDPIGQAPQKQGVRPGATPIASAPRPAASRPADAGSPVVVGDGGVVVKRPAAQ
jgi:cytoskeletal protein CcmA (bactofilin family)